MLIDKSKNTKLIILVILITNLLTMLITLKALTMDYSVARLLSKSNKYTMELAGLGIGGYGLVYSNLALFPFLLCSCYYLLGKHEFLYSLKYLSRLLHPS